MSIAIVYEDWKIPFFLGRAKTDEEISFSCKVRKLVKFSFVGRSILFSYNLRTKSGKLDEIRA